MTMADGLRRIDRHEFGRFNTKMQAFAGQLKNVVSNSRARITILIGLMRQAPLHSNVLLSAKELCDEYNAHGQYLNFEVMDVAQIWNAIRRTVQPEPIALSFELDQWFELGTPMRAVSGTITAAEVASWYYDHGDHIFGRNIRESLGVTQVNADIGRSLREEPHEFWYRNNGITILCDSLKLTPRRRSAPRGPAIIEAENVGVVNGAQTVAAVAAAIKDGDDSVQEALVGVRIIETSDKQANSQITKATNTQNHIERRDFVALDEIQLAIREEFALTLGLTYSIRRSEFEPSPESGCTVREAAIALCCAHSDPSLAQRIRHNEDLLWEEGSAGAYARIFGHRPSAVQIWRSVLLLRKVRDSLNALHGALEGRAAAVADQGSLAIAHLVFQTIGRDGVDDLEYDWEEVLARVPDAVGDAVRWLTVEIDRQFGANSFIGSTLASPDRIRPLVRTVLSEIEAGEPAPELPSDYVPAPRQRGSRRRSSVHILVDAGRVKEGSHLTFVAGTERERQALDAWLNEDSRRGAATWVNSRSRPLVWAADGKRYTPSGLVMRMYGLAEWSDAPVAVQGPSRWVLGNEGSLLAIAQAVQREIDGSEEVDVQ